MKVFTFLGLPASGKGTQADILAKKIDATIIGGGDMVRSEIEGCDLNDPFCKAIKDRYDKGIPQPNEIMTDLVKKNLQNTKDNIIFDNYPFSRGQALAFNKILKEMEKMFTEYIAKIKVPKEE